MMRRVLAFTAAAVASFGMVAAPSAVAQPAEVSSKAKPALTCDWIVDSHHVTGSCFYGGWKRGLLQFSKAYATETLFVTDKRTDDRYASAHIVWWQDGRKRHRSVKDNVADGRGDSIDLNVPDGDRVFLYLCVDGIGCSSWRASRA